MHGTESHRGRNNSAQAERRCERIKTAHAKSQRREEAQRRSPFFALPPLRTLRLGVKPVCPSMNYFTGSQPWGLLQNNKKDTSEAVMLLKTKEGKFNYVLKRTQNGATSSHK
jgi:hypothetical protein